MSPTLEKILSDFPHISLATNHENDEILRFYHQTEINTKANTVIYQRGSNFFRFLQERSQHSLVFLLRDEHHQIQGIAAASYRPGFINGELVTVGYLGDLRVNMSRKLIREWRSFYGTFLYYSPDLPETKNCRYYQTALIQSNNYSKNNLVESKIPNLYYHELLPYQMINIVGRLGFAVHSKEINVRSATMEDKNQIIYFLNLDHKKRMFGHDWTQEFDHRLKNWAHFKISDYLLVTDLQEKILAITSIWNPISSKQIMVPRIPFAYKILEKAAGFIPGLKLKPIPKAMIPIDILYLNQISFAEHLIYEEKKKIFNLIVNHCFERHFSMLAYCDYNRDNLAAENFRIIYQKMDMALYSVHYRSEQDSITRDPLFLNIHDSSPAFDMVLV